MVIELYFIAVTIVHLQQFPSVF